MTVNINAANITSIRLAEQSSNPGTPASGFASLFVDSNGDLATRKDAGGIKIATSPVSGDYTLTVDGTGTAARLNANNVFTGSNRFSNTIAVGGVAPAASGSGVTFPATFSASSDVNTLDDYEEGSFTVTYSPVSGAFGSITYDTQIGRYVRVGSIVHALIFIGTDSFSSGTASSGIQVSLPFVSLNVATFLQAGSLGWSGSWAGDHPSGILVQPNAALALLYYRDTADGDSLYLQAADFSTSANSNYIYALLTYIAA
jgi:hypothetical protein